MVDQMVLYDNFALLHNGSMTFSLVFFVHFLIPVQRTADFIRLSIHLRNKVHFACSLTLFPTPRTSLFHQSILPACY